MDQEDGRPRTIGWPFDQLQRRRPSGTAPRCPSGNETASRPPIRLPPADPHRSATRAGRVSPLEGRVDADHQSSLSTASPAGLWWKEQYCLCCQYRCAVTDTGMAVQASGCAPIPTAAVASPIHRSIGWCKATWRLYLAQCRDGQVSADAAHSSILRPLMRLNSRVLWVTRVASSASARHAMPALCRAG